MASRAEPTPGAAAAPSAAGSGPAARTAPPRLGAVVRAALSDYYFNSMRLVPLNLVWGAAVVLIVFIGLAWPFGGLLLLPLLALPTAVIFRFAARIVRREPSLGLRENVIPGRQLAAAALAIGAPVVAAGVVLGTNVVVGLSSGLAGSEPTGLVLATLAAWGLIGLWCGAIVVWPLVVDPARAGQPIRERLRLAGRLLLVDPIRFGGLALVVALVVAVSVVLTAAILTISVAFVALVACRTVYPAADRLDPRLAGEGS